MLNKSVVGIDPDAKGFCCCLVKNNEPKIIMKEYSVNNSGLKEFVKWIKSKNIIVAIEGSNGQSNPIENALDIQNIEYYSFKPLEIAYFRKAILGQNKNNKNDAEATARYALALLNQNKLKKQEKLCKPDIELRLLTRTYSEKTKEITREKSRLWKYLKIASADLYLTFCGNNPDSEVKDNLLSNKGIIKLLSQKPDISMWKYLTADEYLNAMGGYNYRGYIKIIDEIKKISKKIDPISQGIILTLKQSASTILTLQQHQKEILNTLSNITKENDAILLLSEYKGIATLTASRIIAEIIDIKRFANNNKLASYAGLGRCEHSTGDGKKMVSSIQFNRRLKNAFMTAAKNYIKYNPESHLAGYFRNLMKKRRMPFTEALKRVARALVRKFYKELSSLKEVEESNMASGSDRNDKNHISNISLSPTNNKTKIKQNGKRRNKRLKNNRNIKVAISLKDKNDFY